jgi:hypothetical protein
VFLKNVAGLPTDYTALYPGTHLLDGTASGFKAGYSVSAGDTPSLASGVFMTKTSTKWTSNNSASVFLQLAEKIHFFDLKW